MAPVASTERDRSEYCRARETEKGGTYWGPHAVKVKRVWGDVGLRQVPKCVWRKGRKVRARGGGVGWWGDLLSKRRKNESWIVRGSPESARPSASSASNRHER